MFILSYILFGSLEYLIPAFTHKASRVSLMYKVSLFIIDTKDFHKYLVKSTVLNWSNIWIRVLMAILVPDQMGFTQELH